MKKIFKTILLSAIAFNCIAATTINSILVTSDLSKFVDDDKVWAKAKVEKVSLLAQPMVNPKPKKVTTPSIQIQSINDGKWIAFRMKWKDKEYSEAGKLGEFSDAVAIQFPFKAGEVPAIFMGDKENPVHIYHWRAQYQRDELKGKKDIKDIYPNLSVDMYHMDYKDKGNLKHLKPEDAEQYSYGKAAGNPQSFPKKAVDEIMAEGFGTSAVMEKVFSYARGKWNKGEWTVVIGRPIESENGSKLSFEKENALALAVWQGGEDEVASRKSLTLEWLPLKLVK